MAFSFKDVAEILKIIDASDCEEVVIELKGLRLVVRRGRPGRSEEHGQPALRSSSPGAEARPFLHPDAVRTPPKGFLGGASRTGTARLRRGEAELTVAEGRIGVRAPMVGTFYRRPSPQEPPLVEMGQLVKPGDPLCLIEVMKLYTTIPAPAAGMLEAIAVEDGAPVEFDQLLFVIKPAPS
jgi:acetyl-CoA carboxylase biotin carboxyl carrier protein